jgi:hypothetical protein
MRKRARSKWITADLLRELDELDSPVPYHHAFECSKMVEQHDGHLTTRYCKSRWCIICNRIRMAKRIDAYEPVFRQWQEENEVQFVTLTVPNVPASQLNETLDEMMHQLKLCRRAIRRTRGLDYRAVRSIEVTFNEERGDYHPHFHLAVPGKALALALVEEWLKRWESASEAAQDVRPWDGETASMKELTKYCTKLVAPQDGETIPAEALDVIFRALHGRHLFRPVGFDLQDVEAGGDTGPDHEDVEEIEALEARVPAWSRPHQNRLWWWDETLGDWVDRETGECLTGWSPTDEDRFMRGLDPPEP